MVQEEDNGRKSTWGYFGKMVGLSILGIIVITVAVLTCLSLWMSSYTHHNERVEVPRLVGIPAPEAQRILDNAGLKSMIIDSVYADMKPGAIVEQLPTAGLPVKKGRIVYLTINAIGVRMVKMQEVREGGSRQALSTLRSLGFKVDSIKQVPSEMHDLVLSVTTNDVEMVPGAEYPFGTHVVVSVGNSKLEIEPENEETEEQWLE
ncbi:MAG: PASTA domain-containing protein [Bacteroidales bacterium]|nr:PASTA domain-containing protein [Bacteroidales bacterium]